MSSAFFVQAPSRHVHRVRSAACGLGRPISSVHIDGGLPLAQTPCWLICLCKRRALENSRTLRMRRGSCALDPAMVGARSSGE